MKIQIASTVRRSVRLRRAAAGLFSAWLALACASRPSDGPSGPLDPVRVSIGTINESELAARHRGVPRELAERTELVVDLFWQVGCLGENLNVALPEYKKSPDVLCTLPGRTPSTILVIAHLDGKVGEKNTDQKDAPDIPQDWAGVALLPSLYRALRVVPREHTFVLAAFGPVDRHLGLRGYLARLDRAQRNAVSAVIDLRSIAQPTLWSASEDTNLRTDLVAVVRALERPPETLRFFVPYRPARNPPHIPLISLGGTRETELLEEREDSAPAASAPSASTQRAFYASARVVALYLGYLDDSLRLRSPAQEALPATSEVAPPTVAR